MALTIRAKPCANYLLARGYVAKGARWSETCVRRPIKNRNTWSEHSYANAIDIFGPAGVLDAIAADLNRSRGNLNIATLIWDGGNSPGYDRGTTRHIDHVHVDFAPKCGSLTPSHSCNQAMSDCNKLQAQGGARVTGGGTRTGTDPEDVGPGGLFDTGFGTTIQNPFGGIELNPIAAGVQRGIIGIAGIGLLALGTVLIVAEVKGQALGAALSKVIPKGIASGGTK